MSDLEKFNVDSDLQSIADAMTVAGLNFCGGVFDHLETGEEFELTIAKKSGVRSMADEIAELRDFLAKVATCEIETFSFEVGDSGDTDCIEYVCTDIIEEANELIAKYK